MKKEKKSTKKLKEYEAPASILLTFVLLFALFFNLLVNQISVSVLDKLKASLGSFIAVGDYVFNFILMAGFFILIIFFFARKKNTGKYFSWIFSAAILESILMVFAMILKPESILEISSFSGSDFWKYFFFGFYHFVWIFVFGFSIYFVRKNKAYFDKKNKFSKKSKSSLALASYVLGIIALIPFLGIVPAVLSIVFGVVLLGKKNKKLRGREYAKAGIVLSIFALFFSGMIIVDLVSSNNQSENVFEGIEDHIVYVKYTVNYLSEGEVEEGVFSGSGIIYSSENGELKILTNRHVVDCAYFSDECEDILSENVQVNLNGELVNVSGVSFAPKNFDVALLSLGASGDFNPVNISENTSKGDEVFAVGYPLFSDRVVELSKAKGSIIEYKKLFSDAGFEFEGIGTNAYTYFGSSGGGLFDIEGNLIGMNTWASEDYSYAIKIEYVKNFSDYVSCEEGYLLRSSCVKYCQRGKRTCIRE